MRVPGSARPRLASSAAMRAARACWPVVGDTLSMVARGVRDPGAIFQYKLLYERRGGRVHRRLASGVSAAGGGRVRASRRDPGGAGRPGPGEEPAVGGGKARGLGDPAGAGAGTRGVAAPLGDRAVHRARPRAVGAGPPDAAYEPAVPGP